MSPSIFCLLLTIVCFIISHAGTYAQEPSADPSPLVINPQPQMQDQATGSLDDDPSGDMSPPEIPPQKERVAFPDIAEETDHVVHSRYQTYIDGHYVVDPYNRSQSHDTIYSSNPRLTNQFGLAYTYIQGRWDIDRFRTVIALHTGEIVHLMYQGEDVLLRYVREASLSYEFTPSIVVQGGVMPSLFGFETFVGKDNFHTTRAVMTDFAPDFAEGVRLHYRITQHLHAKLEMTNGWQVLNDNNDSPNVGLVHIYEIDDKLLVNWGLMGGYEPYKGEMSQLRIYSNFFTKVHIGNFAIVPMLDYGSQQNPLNDDFDTWHAYGVTARIRFLRRFVVAARFERMYDPNNIIPEVSLKLSPHGFQMHGETLTLEYNPNRLFTYRLEGKYAYNRDPLFPKGDNGLGHHDFFVMLAAAGKFDF